MVNPLDKSSIDAAIKTLEDEKKAFERKVDLLLKELAEVGRKAAEGAYGTEVILGVVKTSKGYAITANHEQLGFLEFGAGAATAGSGMFPANVFAKDMPFTVEKGSWSRDPSLHANGKTGEYYNTGYQYWHYGKVKYVALMPKAGMQRAYEAINRETQKKIREIFK